MPLRTPPPSSSSSSNFHLSNQTNTNKLGRKKPRAAVTMPLCSFYASTSLPVAKPHHSTKPSPAAAAAAAAATTVPTMTAGEAALTPLHLPELPSHTRDKILSLELMGVDYGRALTLNPSLRDASPESIHSIVTFLQTRGGLQFKDLGRVFGMCPSILTSSVRHDLAPVLAFLTTGLGVPESAYRRVLVKCPRVLACSVRDQLTPALLYLRRLGFRDARALAFQDPVLLVSSVERTMAPKLEFLRDGLGMPREDAVAMVVRCPALFTFNVERNFKPKFKYLVEEMGGGVEDVKAFPQYFTFSLEKRIAPRHRAAVEAGVVLPLPDMLKATDDEFTEMIAKESERIISGASEL